MKRPSGESRIKPPRRLLADSESGFSTRREPSVADTKSTSAFALLSAMRAAMYLPSGVHPAANTQSELVAVPLYSTRGAEPSVPMTRNSQPYSLLNQL